MVARNPSALCERIGERVRARREGLRLSLRELSERTGLSVAHLHAVEHGRTEPGAGTILRLCRALRLSADVLLGVDEPEG